MTKLAIGARESNLGYRVEVGGTTSGRPGSDIITDMGDDVDSSGHHVGYIKGHARPDLVPKYQTPPTTWQGKRPPAQLGTPIEDLSGADLSMRNLNGEDLSKTNLRLANLKGANLQGTNLGQANLESADLRAAWLIRANLIEANLQDADLRGANLRGADLRGANLGGANLEGAVLYQANLQGSRTSNTTRW